MPPPKRIVVVLPSWVGDAVMATPTLRAIRELFPEAKISHLMRRHLKPLMMGTPAADRLLTYRTGKTNKKAGRGMFDLAARLRAGRFDLAILLPNSFKTALFCKMAKIPRVLGYDRDGRGFLLTDRLLPRKEKGKFIPSPIIKAYLGLAQYLGSRQTDLTMRLWVTESDQRRASQVLQRCGLEAAIDHPGKSGHGPLILLNPGANFGAAKIWLPEYFAELGDRLTEELGATILLSSAPKERQIVDAILKYVKHRPIDLAANGMTLGALKEIVRRCDLMITNDTGPRHIAAAMDTPVVTIFGPTHPEWTEIYYAKERQVAVKVFCGPCQKKVCPLDHRCMTRVTPAMVFSAATTLLAAERVTAF